MICCELVGQEARGAVLQQQAEEQERLLEALQLAAGGGFDYCKVSVLALRGRERFLV